MGVAMVLFPKYPRRIAHLVTCLLLVTALAVSQQNVAVPRSALDMGFAESKTGNAVVRSVVGENFVGLSGSPSSVVASGFLADHRLIGPVVTVGSGAGLPLEYALAQNYPNPFNPTTVIEYSVPGTGFVTLIVYDILGREVARLVEESKPAGRYTVRFDASTLASGAYFYRFEARPIGGAKGGGFVSTRKLLLVK